MSILLELSISEEVRVTNYDAHLVRNCCHQDLSECALPCRQQQNRNMSPWLARKSAVSHVASAQVDYLTHLLAGISAGLVVKAARSVL